jgi:hypothetical protein
MKKLLAHVGRKKAITVFDDVQFQGDYPNLWACMVANLTIDNKPRAAPTLTVSVSGVVWIIKLTMPQEEKFIEAESQHPSTLFAALEAKLAAPEPAFRRAHKSVKRQQLQGKQIDLTDVS